MSVTEQERQRILAQGWNAAQLGGLDPFVRTGPPWARQWQLNHRADGSCVFLSEEGRCQVHERFGYDTKPLPCRLFPFVLVPVGNHWSVGLRFACPSAAANKGRPLPGHTKALTEFAIELAVREGLGKEPDDALTMPPRLTAKQRVGWQDIERCVDALLALLLDRRDHIERRLRKCLALANLMRQARLEGIEGKRLSELLDLLRAAADTEAPSSPQAVPPPSWVGRLLFRQAAALFTRKDHGPNRGNPQRNRLALMAAAWRFARGRGTVPRLHKIIPSTTFEQLEQPQGPLPPEAELVLERYYHIKAGSLQFCGPASFGLPLWEGLEVLALTLPITLWLSRAWQDRPRREAVEQALAVVDDHIGFNRVLASRRQRLAFRILARRGELARLIAWYSR